MQAKEIVKRVEEIITPFIEENGFELVEVEFVKEASVYYLRIYADKTGGFSIDDCELLSRFAEKKIDAEDFIEPAYILEVSSPGIDRALKKDFEYEKYKGRNVDVKLYKPVDGIKQFSGSLKGLIDGKIVIFLQDGEELSFDKKDVSVCRLSVEL